METEWSEFDRQEINAQQRQIDEDRESETEFESCDIEEIQIIERPGFDGKTLATADVIFKSGIALNGLRILKGRYGLFVAFPSLGGSIDVLKMRIRMRIQAAVLRSYKHKGVMA